MKGGRYLYVFVIALITAIALAKFWNIGEGPPLVRSSAVFQGLVIDKFFSHGYSYSIRTQKSTLFLSKMSPKFDETVTIGDSIVKADSSNSCLVLKDSHTVIRVPFSSKPID